MKPLVCKFAMGWSLERLVRVTEKLDAWRSGGHTLTLTNLTDITSRVVSETQVILQMAHDGGEIMRSSQVTGVYRLHEGGVTAVKRADDAFRWKVERFAAALELREYCRRRGNEQSRKYWDMRLAKVCLATLDNRGSLLRAASFTGKKFLRLALRKVKRLFRERL